MPEEHSNAAQAKVSIVDRTLLGSGGSPDGNRFFWVFTVLRFN